jgi:PBSX family phage terminase large subunit
MSKIRFSPKALAFIRRPPEQDRMINILQGATRSGKTFACIPKILTLCKYKVDGHRVICGVTKATVYKNYLAPLFGIIGPKNYTFNKNSGELTIFGVPWIVEGAADEGAVRRLQGLTIGILLIDEVANVPKTVFEMLYSRMSPEGARLYATCNPASSYHWLKTDWLDNPAKQQDLWTEVFYMRDNLSLSEETIARYERSFTGAFKRRMIGAEWCNAEGAIYSDAWSDAVLFDDGDMPAGLLNDRVHLARYCTVDVGTKNQFVSLDVIDDGRTLWVLREFVWDSAKEKRQKTNGQYADDIQAFLKSSPTAKVIIDPSAASMKAELVQRGIWHSDGKNDVLPGIQAVATMLATGRLRVHRDCTNLISQMASYAWDEKAALRGEEKPLKVADHGPDALRYCIFTEIPEYRLATAA